MSKRIISILLVLSMIVSMLPVSVFADEQGEDNTIKYVSLGDSMTNGYGLTGYDHNSGVEDYGDGAYPNQFADELEKAGYTVDHAQLAMSGIRTEDIHWLLEFDYNNEDAIAIVDYAVRHLSSWIAEDTDIKNDKIYGIVSDMIADESIDEDAKITPALIWNAFFGCGDYWTVDEIVDHSRINATFAHIAGMTDYETYTGCDDHEKLVEFPETVEDKGTSYKSYSMAEKIAVVAKYYQENVFNADIISLSVGNGNLGVFGFGRILEAIGFDSDTTYLNYNYEDLLRECEPEMKERLMALIDEIKPMMAAYLPDPALEGVVLYIAVSLAMNYAGTLDAILQENPDVEIILVPVMNTFGDNYAAVEGALTIGDMLGLVVDPLNKFIAGLPTYMQVTNHGVYKDAKFYWAESGSVQCMVDTYEGGLSDIVRDRFVESIVGYCDCGENHDAAGKNPNECTKKWEAGMIWGMLGGKFTRVSMSEIKAYEALNDAGKLAFAAGTSVTVNEGAEDEYTVDGSAEKAAAIAAYLAFEKAIIEGKDNPVTLNSVFGLGETLGGGAFDGIMATYEEKAAIAGKDKLDAVCEFLAATAKQTLEDTINTKVRAFLVSKGYSEEDAKLVSVEIAVTGDQIKAIVTAANADAKTAAANVIANNAVNAVVTTLGPIYKGMTVAGVASGLDDLIEGINGVVFNMTSVPLGLTTEGYYTALTEDNTYDAADANAFVDAFYADSVNDFSKLKKYIDDSAPMPIGETVVTNIQTDKTYGPALIEAEKKAGSIQTEDGIATAVKTMLNGMVDGDAVAYISGMLTGLITADTASSLCTLLVTPDTLSGVIVDDVKFGGLLALFARCYIGNGIGAHPSQTGHDELARAVIAAYGNKTAEDKTDENLDMKEWPVAKKIISDLTAQGLLNDDQILEIVFAVYEAYKNDMSLEGDLFVIVDAIYNVLFQIEEGMADEDRLTIISIVYDDLKVAGYLKAYEGYLNTLEAIIALPSLEEVPDYKTFALVERIYMLATDDGELSFQDVRAIIGYIWNVTLKITEAEQARMFSLRSSSLEELTVADKLAIMKDVIGELAANKEVQKTYPQVESVVELYDTLTSVDAEGDQIVPDEVLIELFDEVMATAGDPAVELTEEVINGVTTEIATTILTDERIKPENKVVILEAVVSTLEDVGMGDVMGDVTGGGNSSYDLAVIVALRDRLEAAGYLTPAQQGEIVEAVSAVLPTLIAGQMPSIDEMAGIIDDVYNIVFNREDLTAEDKLAILLITYDVLDEYGYIDNAYALGYAKADEMGYIDLATSYIDIAIGAVGTGKEAAVNFPVDAELAGIKEALLAEFDAATRTLNKINELLATDALSTKDGAWTELLGLREELDNHIAKILTLADEIGFVADPYVTDVINAAIYYAQLIDTVANNAYTWIVTSVKEFNVGYATWVEEMGTLADKVDPALGVAVRKYLTETPADTLAILYAYGEEATLKLFADAAAAADDIYTAAANLAGLLAEHGNTIYAAVTGSEEYAEILNEIKALIPQLEELMNEAMKAPASAAANYDAEIAKLMGVLDLKYAELFNTAIEAVKKADPTVGQALQDAMDALMKSLGFITDASNGYAAWLPGHMDAMAGELLNALLENTKELTDVAGPIIDTIILSVLNETNNFLMGVVADTEAQIRAQIAILEAELKSLKAEAENAAGELYEQIMAQISVVEAKIDELKAILADGLGENILRAGQLLVELKNEVVALAEAAKAAALNEAYEALNAIAADLDELDEIFTNVLGEKYEAFKAQIGELGNYLLNKLADAVIKYAPELADDIYNYLYNNPEQVIAFFEKYGPYMLDMTEEYGDEALAVVAVVFYLYGEDIVDYVVDNHEAILGAISNWIDVHGENAAELIQVYAEALGLCDAVRDQIAILENAIAELEAEAKAQIAVLEAQIAELKAQLETADAELKAQIEAQIAELEAKIEALKGEVAIKIAEVKAAIAELEAALKAVIEKGFTDVNELVAAVMNLTKAVNELVVAVNELAIERLTDAVNKVQEALVNLDNTLYQMIGETYNELKALLWMAVEDLVNQIVETIKKTYPEVADWIYTWLYENPEKVIAFFVEYGEAMFDFVNEYIEEIAAVMAYLAYNFGDDVFEFFVENADEIMQTITRWMKMHGENAWELVKVYLDALGALDVLESIDAHVAEKIAGFEAALKELYAQLDALKAQLEDAIASGNAELAAKLEAAIAKVEAEIAKIEAMIARIMAVLEKLGNDIADIYDAINEIINIVDSYADWDVLLPLLRDAFNKLIDAVVSAIDTAAMLEMLETALNKLINEGMDALVDYLKGLGDQAVSAIAEAMENALRKLSVDVASLIKKALNSIVVMVHNAVTNVITGALNGEYTVSDDSHYVAITGNNSGYIDVLADRLWLTDGQYAHMTWNDLDYEELEKADLITIGYDENNLSSFAVEQLFGFVKNYLDVTVRENTNAYVDRIIGKILSKNPLLSSEWFAPVPGAVNDALDQVLAVEMLANRTMVDMDWEALIGEENLHYVDELRADLKEELLAGGIPEVYVVEINVIDYMYDNAETLGISGALRILNRDVLEEQLAEDAVYTIEIPVVDAAVFAAESYVYGVLEFNVNYAKTVMTLQQVNPDVALVVLGNYNAFRNVELSMGDVTLNLGEAYEKLAKVSSIHPFAYAILMSNVTYVDIMDVETNYEAMVKAGMIENSFMNFLMMYLTDGSITEASAAGNEYIVEQIMNALKVSCDHIYDDECTDAICNRCGAERTVGHSYGEWVITAKPTCTEPGEETRACFCGASETREVSATGHSFTNYVSDDNATCTEDGTKTAQCDNGCGETDTVVDEGSMLEHNYENGACTECGAEDPNYTPVVPPVVHTHTPVVLPGVAATCTTTGLTEGVACAYCDVVLVAQKVIPALGHKEEAIAAVEATCTTAGLTEGKKCSVCGEILVAQKEIPALGHKEEVVAAVEATCATNGLTEGKKCSVCGEILVAQEEISALGHKYESVVIAPTCTSTGYTAHTCSVCGHSYQDSTTAKREHKWDAGVIIEEPTCTKLGTKEIKCMYDDCDASFLDKQVPALGHTEEVVAGSDATCTKTGLTEGKKCSVCGETLVAQEEIPAKGHSFGEWTVTKEATTKEEGEETRTCACGETETRTIEKLAKDNKTVTVVITLGSITGVGGIAIAAYFLLKKKRIF